MVPRSIGPRRSRTNLKKICFLNVFWTGVNFVSVVLMVQEFPCSRSGVFNNLCYYPALNKRILDNITYVALIPKYVTFSFVPTLLLLMTNQANTAAEITSTISIAD